MHVAALTLATLMAKPHFVEAADFQINTDGTTSEQSHPRLSVAPDGTFAVAWQDFRNGNGDIYLQRLSDAGELLVAEQPINSDTLAGYQSSPSLAVDKTGQFITVWLDYRLGTYPLDPEIYLQRLDSTVMPVGANRNLTSVTPDSLKASPDVALSPFGGGVVVWEDCRNKSWDIWGQRIAATGAPVGSQFRINDDVGTAQQHSPRVAYSSEGWFVVVWYDNRWGDDDIYVQRFDSVGNKRSVNIRASGAATGTRQAFPDVAADDAGHFTVVWTDWRNGTYPSNPDIYARRYDTMMVAGEERKVNTDASTRAQLSPSIAADRRGNVAIVWADSGSVSWDIRGQMIDADGQIRESNFRANTVTDSAQLQPDVALDGRNRYVTWADKRSGHFDIFGSITQYNDPHVTATPSVVQFSMLINGSLPASQSIGLQQVGYNPIHYKAVSSAAWLAVTPLSGVTPDSVVLAVTDPSLAAGLHSAAITIIDTDNDDSSCVVLVRLEVQSPLLGLVPDTLLIRAFAGVKYPVSGAFQVVNAGTGNLAWSASESTSWLDLTKADGVQGEVTEVAVTAESLAVGSYYAPIEIISSEAANSPETAWIALEAIDDLPYIAAIPDTVFAEIVADTVQHFGAEIVNLGNGELNWSAVATEPWIIVETAFGVAGDSVRCAVDPSQLALGVNAAQIVLTDSSALNISFYLPVIIDYEPPPQATVRFGSAQMQMGESAPIAVTLVASDAIAGARIPVAFDSTSLTLDSVTFGSPLPSGTVSTRVDCPTGNVVTVSFDSGLFVPGEYLLANLYFGARVENALCPIDTARCDSGGVSATLAAGGGARMAVEAGEVLISPTTDVGDHGGADLPTQFALHENYPNPFNLNTIITFDLPVSAEVQLEVFNILGQSVASLVKRPFPAGHHVIEWNGRGVNGGELSSGVYFYRLQADDRAMVKRMVLLK